MIMSNVYNILPKDLLVNKTGEDKMVRVEIHTNIEVLKKLEQLAHSEYATRDISDTKPHKTHHFVKLIIPQQIGPSNLF